MLKKKIEKKEKKNGSKLDVQLLCFNKLCFNKLTIATDFFPKKLYKQHLFGIPLDKSENLITYDFTRKANK